MVMKYLIAILVLLAAGGCNALDIRPDRSSNDRQLLEREAARAYQAQDWVTAEGTYLELTRQSPAIADYWFRLGNIYAQTDRLDEAVIAYKQALERDSGNSRIWHNLGIVHLRQATSTFIDMLDHTAADDPLNNRARHVVISVTELMETGFDTTPE